jgi:hypothetical protein
VPVLFTHHFRQTDESTGALMGAVSDLQAGRARELVEGAGQSFEYQSFPQMPHSMHGADPALFARTVTQWASALVAAEGSQSQFAGDDVALKFEGAAGVEGEGGFA